MTPRLRWVAAPAALALVALSPLSSTAATQVAKAEANALTLTIAGSPVSSGDVVSTHNGKKETVTGEANPPIAVLGNQDLLDIGVLAQEVKTSVANKKGKAQACSGIAGDGASVADVGESNCITPGDPIGVNLTNLDLTGAVLIDPKSALGPLSALNAIVDQLVAPLTSAIEGGLGPFANTGLTGTFGTVQSRCSASPGNLTGTANIADSTLELAVAGQTVPLVNLPASPPPNTKVVTDLDVVLDTIIDAVKVDLDTTLNGLAAPLKLIVQPIQDQVVDLLIKQISDQLAPLEENVLDITLNKQTRSDGRIAVNALTLELLPAATQFGAPQLLTADIANVACGPTSAVTDDDDDDGDDGGNDDGNNNNGGNDDFDNNGPGTTPIRVDSGAAGDGGNGLPWGFGFGLIGAAAVTAGWFGRRWWLPRV